MGTEVTKLLDVLFANSYILFLKTQNYHWNIKGQNFLSLHEMLNKQYNDLIDIVDEIAERIVYLNGVVYANFKVFENNRSINDGDEKLDCVNMLKDLVNSYQKIISITKEVVKIADENGDIATSSLMSAILEKYEKNTWMLKSCL